MRALVFGGTGMIGQGLVLELVRDPGVTKVILVGRAASSAADPKIEQHTVRDLTDLAPIRTALTGIDACFWCLGISSVGLDEAAYRRITYEYTVAAAKQLIAWNPSMAFIFVSGASTDSSEKGAVMWARVKGAAENAILGMGFGRAHCVRPAFIQPSAGIRSRTAQPGNTIAPGAVRPSGRFACAGTGPARTRPARAPPASPPPPPPPPPGPRAAPATDARAARACLRP
jgi:uncharacterized protein YbjT (DUF2867 family)